MRQPTDVEMSVDSGDVVHPFGLEFFESLTNLGGLSFLTRSMRYRKVQELKSADRSETLSILRALKPGFISYFLLAYEPYALFSYDDPELEVHVKRDSGAELADWLYGRENWIRAKIRNVVGAWAVALYLVWSLSVVGK